MGGLDKAALELDGANLIGHVFERLRLQTDEIVISGSQSYGLEAVNIPDNSSVAGGPVAGVLSVAAWFSKHRPDSSGFLTVPVDGPEFPPDLAALLAEVEVGAAIAVDEDGLHPTFAWWPIEKALAVEAELSVSANMSLKGFAAKLNARRVVWEGRRYFQNLNTPEDFAAWRKA